MTRPRSDRARQALGSTSLTLGVVFVGAILVMLNYLGHRHYWRGDWTRRGLYSLSEKSAQLVRGLKQDVELTVFMGTQLQEVEGRDTIYPEVKELLTRMRRHSSRLKVQFIDQEKDPQRAEMLIKQHGVTSDDDLRGGVVVVRAGERKKYVTADEMSEYGAGEAGPMDRRLKAFKGEQKILSALLAVTQGKQHEVCWTSSHEEGDLESFDEKRGFSALAAAFKRDNYKLTKLEALEKGVPKGCDLVLVNGPLKPFTEDEVKVLESHLKEGGKLLAFHGLAFTREAKLIRTGLEPLLARWGAKIGDNVVVDLKGLVRWEPNPFTWGTRDGYGDHVIATKMRGRLVSFPFSRSVSPEEGKAPTGEKLIARALVKTSQDGYGETSFDSVAGENDLRFDPATDVKGPVSVGVAASVPKPGAGKGKGQKAQEETRLVVFGSSAMLQNYRLEPPPFRVPIDDDVDLALAATAWLVSSEELVAVGPKTPEHVKLVLSEEQVRRIFLISVLVLPFTALLLGGALWYGRRS